MSFFILYKYYIIIFFKNQKSVFHFEQFFFLLIVFHEYKFLIFYIQSNHFDLDNPNNYQYQAKNIWEVEGAICAIFSYSLLPFLNASFGNFISLFTHLVIHRYMTNKICSAIINTSMIITTFALALVASFY